MLRRGFWGPKGKTRGLAPGPGPPRKKKQERRPAAKVTSALPGLVSYMTGNFERARICEEKKKKNLHALRADTVTVRALKKRPSERKKINKKYVHFYREINWQFIVYNF